MRKKHKIKKRAAILVTSCLVGGSLIAGNMLTSVQAATRLYGVQQIVENLSSGSSTFDILEIVPDYADASMGYYCDGSDVIIDGKYLANAANSEERKDAIETLLQSISKDQMTVSLKDYQERLYESSDSSMWGVLDRSSEEGTKETRQGQFKKADDVKGAMGNYTLSPKLSLSINLYNEEGRLLQPSDESIEIGDTITVRLNVSSGRRSENEDEVLPAEISLTTTGTGTLTSTETAWDSATGHLTIDNIYQLSGGIYEFSYQITDADKQNTGGVSFRAEGTVNGDRYAANGRNITYPDYNSDTSSSSLDLVVTQELSETTSGAKIVNVTFTCARRPEQNVTFAVTTMGVDVAMTIAPDQFQAQDDKYVYTLSYDAEETEVAEPETTTEASVEEQGTDETSESSTEESTEDAELEPTTATTYTISPITVNGTEISGDHGSVELSFTDVTVEAGAALISEEVVEHKNSVDDFWYDETDGEYVWVDGNDSANGDVEATIPVGKVYYKVQVEANSMFASQILELTDASEQKLYEKVVVHTYTPADLEEALLNNSLAMGNMDLVYVSNSSILDTTVLTGLASYWDKENDAYSNDISLDTAFNIYQYAMNANLPVMVDKSIMSTAAEDAVKMQTNGASAIGNNVLRLAYLLQNYTTTGVAAISEASETDWTAEFITALQGTSAAYGTYGSVYNNIFFNNDADKGCVVSTKLTDVIFTYKSQDNNFGEDVVAGMANLVGEISNDNFYNKNNADEYTTGYSMDDFGFETIEITKAVLIRYILNYDQRRVTLYKDNIKVLDIEPTKYSTLSEEDIQGWLGLRATYQVTVNNGSQMTYDSSSNTIQGAAGIKASERTYTHNWSSSNTNTIVVNGNSQNATIRVVGAGTATISHHYYYYSNYSHENKDENTETITFTVTEDASGESGIKELSITQLSTPEFIGTLEDLIENYDMIYIGACTGPKGIEGSMNQDNSGKTKYNDSSLDGKIYLHVGDKVYSTHSALRGLMDDEEGVNTVTTRYSGNDLTEDKYNELLEYAKAGYPIVFDQKLYDGQTVNTGYLDNSSYMYKLIKSVAQGYTSTKVITNEEYEKLSEESQKNWTRGEDATYTHTYLRTNKNYKLTRITSTASLNDSNAKYVLANGNNYVYWMVSGSDRSLSNSIAADLNSSPSAVTVAKTSIPDEYLWNITVNYGKAKVKSSSNKYLYCTGDNNSADGAALSNTEQTMRIGSSDQVGNAFYLYNDNYGYSSYLNARDNKAGTWTWGDAGSSWFIYKVEEVDGDSFQVTDKITATEYAQHEGQTGYEKQVTYYWTKSETQDGVPNVMPSNTSKSVLNKLVKYINMPRLNVVLTSEPKEYSSTTNNDGTLSKVGWMDSVGGKYYLTYEFEFSNTAESAAGSSDYTVSLFVDVNADGRYVPSEELDGLSVTNLSTKKAVAANALKTGVRYRVRRELPQDYVGLLPWKLIISMNTASDNTTVRASEIGYTAVPNNTSTATVIKVLQIMPGSSSVNLNTTGYFPSLIKSVENQMNYDLQITPITVADIKTAYSNGRYTDGEDFYERYLKSYDMLIWGYSDMYGSKDFDANLIKAFGLFIDSGKSTLFSHDLTSFNNGHYGSGVGDWGYYMNQYLRSAAGMDRYGITENALSFLKSKNSKTTYTMGADNWKSVLANNKDVATAPTTGTAITTYGGAQGFTNNLMNYYFNDTYRDIVRPTSGDPTRVTKISQTNEGQITKYPFNVDITAVDSATGEARSQWRESYNSDYFVENTATASVATTHYQYYQLDYNYDTDGDGTNNLVVWYALNGGTYAAQPNDVRNNYYIYSVGNITYTGMGHTGGYSDPGITKMEAQLFVNTIVAAYNAGTKNPSVNIVENVDDKNSSVEYIYRTFDEDAPADNQNDETFAFYVNDTNVIQGTKRIDVWYYREISKSTYDAAVTSAGSEEAANAAGYYQTALVDGTAVYLQAYSKNEGDTNYIGNVLSEYQTVAENYITYEVEVKGSWINNRLENASQGNAVIWVGARTTLDYTAVNKKDEVTDRVFDCITFKKRNLIELD